MIKLYGYNTDISQFEKSILPLHITERILILKMEVLQSTQFILNKLKINFRNCK